MIFVDSTCALSFSLVILYAPLLHHVWCILFTESREPYIRPLLGIAGPPHVYCTITVHVLVITFWGYLSVLFEGTGRA
jgi:hypothetical protein